MLTHSHVQTLMDAGTNDAIAPPSSSIKTIVSMSIILTSARSAKHHIKMHKSADVVTLRCASCCITSFYFPPQVLTFALCSILLA